MRTITAYTTLFCWILFVLLVFEINQPDTFIKKNSYTVSQDGIGTDLSVEEFNEISGPHPNFTFYFSGIITTQLTPKVYGKKEKRVVFDGGNNAVNIIPVEWTEWEDVPVVEVDE